MPNRYATISEATTTICLKVIRYDIRTHGEFSLADVINLMHNFGEPFKGVEIGFDHFTYARDFE